MPDTIELPHGPDVALEGLRRAVARIEGAAGQVLRGGGGAPVWIALSEALYWVAALDDGAAADANYYRRRNEDQRGRTVGGLVFAHNAHAHELVSAGQADFEMGTPVLVTGPPPHSPSPGRGTLFTMRLQWVPLAELPPPARMQTHGRDIMYGDNVGGRLLTDPLAKAIAWFESLFALSPPEEHGTEGA